MKKLMILCAVALLGFSTSGMAQSDKATTQQEEKSPFDGVVKFEKDTVDFGETKYNDPVTVTYTFTNIGKKPLIIKGAQASCGCTTPSWTKAPILPGKTGEIKASYNASDNGRIYKTVFVNFQGIPPAKQLIITGKVVK